MILVTGATGTRVRRWCGRCWRAGRTCARSSATRRRPRAASATRSRSQSGDFADPASVRAALDGVEQLFLSGADDPRRVAVGDGAIDAAVAAGVRRIVKLSSIVAAPGAPVAFWDWHGQRRAAPDGRVAT